MSAASALRAASASERRMLCRIAMCQVTSCTSKPCARSHRSRRREKQPWVGVGRETLSDVVAHGCALMTVDVAAIEVWSVEVLGEKKMSQKYALYRLVSSSLSPGTDHRGVRPQKKMVGGSVTLFFRAISIRGR